MSRGDFSHFDDIDCGKSIKDEEHYNENCSCKKKKVKRNGRTVFVWYRICYCGYHTDRTSEYNRAEIPDNPPKDGIDIHYNESCYYRTEKHRGCIWNSYKFVLYCYCQRRSAQNAQR
ncbi:uncharacterized protein LOC133181050 [Saccostrea echinata]|uniref:uncharacterized protein LOC133181050 n=1 Tax=Saccostrea echinata TaxID=191078 RepID=UPI002A802656|nr:uncharacterized protein LOC133181050 [Saccostrea echinata]